MKKIDTRKPAALAAALLLALASAASADPAVAIKAGDKAFVVEGFENVAADGKIMVGANKTLGYVNLTKSGWGGSEGLVISSSTENATEGKYSARIDIDFQVRNRKWVNGACFGMGWDNAGATPESFGKNLRNVAYMIVDYVWKPAPECNIANPKVLNIGIHIASTAKGEINDFANTDPSGKGTLVVKLTNTIKEGELLTPQFALKVYHPFDDQDLAALAGDAGKTVKGTLWLDNIRFADAEGKVFQQ
jgi:hypothetical protein